METNNRLASILSLASRAQKVVSGEESVEKALQSGLCQLIIISGEASGNTKKKFTNKCHYYNTDIRTCGSTEELSRAIGKRARVVVAINDIGFARLLKDCLDDDGGENVN